MRWSFNANNVEHIVEEISCEGVNWINAAQSIEQLSALLNTAMNFL
jgi:hypothetical protein